MEKAQNEKKELRERTKALLQDIGASLKHLRKESGYGNSVAFAIQKGIPEGSYGKHEAGSENITMDSLVSYMEAHGLTNEDVFNTDFLTLGKGDQDNPILSKLVNNIADQVRHQVSLLNNIAFANTFSDQDARDLRRILKEGEHHSSRQKLVKSIGLSSKTKRSERLINFLLKADWLAMTLPDKANSSKQNYYTTEAGKKVLRVTEG